MEFFKFNYDTYPTQLERGQIINGIDTSMWVERYSEPGEFEFTAQLSTGIKDFLPIGTIISHADTLEVMIVENHEIQETVEDDPVVTISGRSFVSYLENRVVGMNAARSSSTLVPYTLAADYTWNQIVALINDHIFTPVTTNDALVNVRAVSTVPGTGVSEIRNVEFEPVWDTVADILKIDDLGIKTIRRNTFGVQGSSSDTYITVYKGIDKSASVIFSWKGGDISTADYLFSNKELKNSALVIGKFLFIAVDVGGLTQYNRRIMIVKADDIDGHLTAVPTGVPLTTMLNAMTVRGRQEIAKQSIVTMSQTDVSKTSKYLYRKDYNMGDLIALDGNFGQIALMRVIEYAEIEDENGESGHPTLSLPGA
jgi:hypothetical protein